MPCHAHFSRPTGACAADLGANPQRHAQTGTGPRHRPHLHGRPKSQERHTFRSDYQALLASGICVFAPNIRGSSGFSKAFMSLDNHEGRFDANKDIKATADLLVDAGIGAKAGWA